MTSNHLIVARPPNDVGFAVHFHLRSVSLIAKEDMTQPIRLDCENCLLHSSLFGRNNQDSYYLDQNEVVRLYILHRPQFDKFLYARLVSSVRLNAH